MNTIDRRLETLAARARQASATGETQANDAFASKVFMQVATRPNTVSPFPAMNRQTTTITFFERLFTNIDAALWLRFSLASLPIGTIVMIACLLWSGVEVPHDVDDLASLFVQSPLLP